jgi:phytoene/squalene synthetase
MNDDTADLARSITFSSSKQSFFTACLLVDNDLVDDCLQAYAYFRWVDDVVDISSQSRQERINFIERQRDLINQLYASIRPVDLTPEENIIADLICHDRGENSGLRSFINNFIAIIEFDAHRKGRLITQEELTWYSECLGKAVTDAIQYFIRNGHPYPDSENRYKAATAAHITHMLRDMYPDISEGYINIPKEYLAENNLNLNGVNSPVFRAWVKERVKLARKYITEGKGYLDELNVLRCKIAGYWYCARFEVVLDTIERDGFNLRTQYDERNKFTTWLKMAWLGIYTTLKHVTGLNLRYLWRSTREVN